MFNQFEKLCDLKCGSYARKSNEADEKQAQSIPDQRIEVGKLEERYQLQIIHTETDEKSAKEAFRRKGFTSLLGKIQKGEINTIVCWKLNRLARNGTEAGMIIDLLMSGVLEAIITATKVYFPTDNPMLMYVEFGIAQNTSKDISTDVMRGQRLKAQRGWLPSPRLRMGYMHNRDYKLKGADAIIGDHQFYLVKQLWKEAVEHRYSFQDIKRRGDELGIRNPIGKYKGRTYSSNAYRDAFIDPFYATGEYWWNTDDGGREKYLGKHEKMLTEQEFNKVQLSFGRRGRPTRINKNDYPLSGCLSCGECGCAIVSDRVFRATCTKCKKRFSIKTSTKCPRCEIDISEMNNPVIYDRSYYRCSKKRGKCSQKFVEAVDAEKQVQDKLMKIHISKDFHEWAVVAFQYLHQQETHEQDNFNRQINKKETELVQQLREFVLMRSQKEITADQLKDLSKDTEKELQGIRSSKKEFHDRVIDWARIANDYASYAETAPTIFAGASNDRKREILRTFGSNLLVEDAKLAFEPPKALMSIHSAYNLHTSKNIPLKPTTDFIPQGSNGDLHPSISTLLPD